MSLLGGGLRGLAGSAAALALLGLALAGTTASAQEGEAVGAVRGTVFDADFQVPLSRVRVSVLELGLSAVTDDSGGYVIENVPPGSYTLSFTRDGYERAVRAGVVVTAGRLAEVSVELGSEVYEMEELVVTGADPLAGTEFQVLEIRAESLSLQDAISADVISKSGASDVSQALRLVVGASVADGKYATVRGLSDRYTGTTLNGVRVPSADPRKRAVQIDQFRAEIVESVTVTKTFTPDLLADFTGGGVDIRTKSVPDEQVLSVSFSLENDSNATGNADFLTYENGGVEDFALAGGERDLPGVTGTLLPPLESIRYSANPSQASIDAANLYDTYTSAFEPVMGTTTGEPGLNRGVSLVYGDSLDLAGGGTFGGIGAFTWKRDFDFYQDGENNNIGVSGIDEDGTYNLSGDLRTDSRGTEEVRWAALANLGWQPAERHAFDLRLLYNQAASDEARFQETLASGGAVEQNQSLYYVERNTTSAQLHGNHALDRVIIDWTGSWNTTSQDEPDVRFFRNDFVPATLTYSSPLGTGSNSPSDNTRRIFRFSEEENFQLSGSVEIPFTQWSESEGNVKAGLYLDTTDRNYEQESFTYRFALPQFGSPFQPGAVCNQSKGINYVAPSPDVHWSDVFTDADRTGLAPGEVYCDFLGDFGINDPVPTPAPNQLLWVVTPLSDDVPYDATQDFQAVFAMSELPLTARTKLIFGARLEGTEMEVVPRSELENARVRIVFKDPDTGERFIAEVPTEEAGASLDEDFVLPALGVVHELRDGMNLRLSGSKTIARPTFLELAPVLTEEFLLGDTFVGNTELVISEILNADLRWEWFRRPGEVLAASLFYKDLTNPIEYITFNSGGETFYTVPENFESGRVTGWEVEAKTALDLISPKLAGLSVGFNYTDIESEVDIPADLRNIYGSGVVLDTRPLQGQPEYVLNLNLSYDNERTGTSFGLFYNVVGDTLQSGAARGEDVVPDQFNKELKLLNFTFTQRLPRGWAVRLAAKNLLQDEVESFYRLPNGQELTRSFRETPMRISLGFSWKKGRGGAGLRWSR